MNEWIEQLISKALEAKNYSYSPYSGFQVGAALLTKEQQIFTGCNIESASYTPTNCAERTAFFKAISEGSMNFKAIAIVGGQKEAENVMAYPCGVCRQVLAEFCDPKDFLVIVAKSQKEYKSYRLEELLPYSFGKEQLS